MFNQKIERFQNEQLLPQNTADGLKVIGLKFCIVSKINKLNNPGILEINSVGCHTSENPRFVDHHPQPVVKQIPSYVKDTNRSINKVNNFPVQINSILIILDARSFYTSIPSNEGIATTKTAAFIKVYQPNISITNSYVKQLCV